MQYSILLFFCLLLFSCQNSPNDDKDTARTKQPTKVKEVSPTTRFNNFMEQFATIELPYTLSTLNNFPRMEDAFIEHFLDAENDSEYGLTKSAHCIATFKVGHNLAIIYKWMQRPAPGNASDIFELAIYTPYGSKLSAIVLGENQNSHQEFSKKISFDITNDFQIITKHNLDLEVEQEEKGGPPSLIPYHSFYTNHYKITEEGKITQTKAVEPWEMIPNEFLMPFLESYKKFPKNTVVKIVKENGKTILSSSETPNEQVIFYPLPMADGDTVLFVSSLALDLIEDTKEAEDRFYINSRIALLDLDETRLRIVTNEIIDSSAWAAIYETIKTECDCIPSPNVNQNGLVNLTTVGSITYNSVYADVNSDNQIVFKCSTNGVAEDKVIYTLSD
jgi:hypothetical protein